MSSRHGAAIQRIGNMVLLAGVSLPLLMIGGVKFTAFEVEALKPLIGGTPWMAWLYDAFGYTGAARLLGVVEIIAAGLLLASPWLPRAGIAGAALAAGLFLGTISMMLALPVWEPTAGGFPALGGLGQFLIKDIALLGGSLLILGQALERSRSRDSRLQ